ncbi:hypothetical protein NDU88_000968 [Pleurodeles waltl]|uniref:Uncharacterized protein n=1 Tax=Pleurodeles waltl TaxID=8319 RepID=A0AAV7Q1T0_PLEWA|nr:hypothetical protein NDU88_000968 [Pleurodeles waltl]
MLVRESLPWCLIWLSKGMESRVLLFEVPSLGSVPEVDASGDAALFAVFLFGGFYSADAVGVVPWCVMWLYEEVQSPLLLFEVPCVVSAPEADASGDAALFVFLFGGFFFFHGVGRVDGACRADVVRVVTLVFDVVV